MKRTAGRTGWTLALTAVLLLAATQAHAQCSFDTSQPSEGDVLDRAPDTMVINFLFGIHLQNVRLVGADGTVWPIDWQRTEDNVFKAEFRTNRTLPPGRYQVEWIAYVRQHHHPDGGVIPFTVAAPDSAIAAPAESGADVGVRPAAAPPADAARRADPAAPYRALLGASARPQDR
jgi:methionine-rich copper-binding protein CopC